ncbi:hypothetical protein IAU60_006313 [Kwoniella sp. DSM 27419]
MSASPLPIAPLGAPIRTEDRRRDRSDTSSSSSSFPTVQTPRTPTISGVLHGLYTSLDDSPGAKGVLAESPVDLSDDGRRRADSYGFTRETEGALGEEDALARQSPQTLAGSPLAESPLAEPFAPDPPLTISGLTIPTEDWRGTAPSLTHLPSRASTPFEHEHEHDSDARDEDSALESEHRYAYRSEGLATSKGKMRAAWKRTFKRSPSSFSLLRKASSASLSGNETPNAALNHESGDASSADSPQAVSRPKASRFKSLLTMSRTHSSASIGTVTPHVSALTQLTPMTRRDVGGTHSLGVQLDMTGPVSAPLVERISSPSDQYLTGSARAETLDSGSTQTINVPPPSSIVHRPRTLSAPLPYSHSSTEDNGYTDLVAGVETSPSVEASPDYFNHLLPHELQVMVMQTLLDSYAVEAGHGRWTGEAGGRKELIRLSRVSKQWQLLCFDGQLWPLVQLNPLAHVLHPRTFERIVSSALPFIQELSLRGMDTLVRPTILSALWSQDQDCQDHHEESLYTDNLDCQAKLPNLHTLDLRGCKSLLSRDIMLLLAHCPGLRVLNMQGVQGVNSEVVRTLARSSTSLESLNLSRCWDLTLGDIIVFVRSIDDDKAGKIRHLRIAGVKSFGHHASELLPLIARRLVSLETLDMAGCTHLYDVDFQRYVEGLEGLPWEPRTQGFSNIRHLALSGCSSLTQDVLKHLTGRLPSLTTLELANLPDLFGGATNSDMSLVNLLKTTPGIQRIDLEGTGIHGGVTDRVLDTLSLGRDEDGRRVGKELRELRIGFAKDVTPQAMIRLMRKCGRLQVLELDNTSADRSVLKEFHRLSGSSTSALRSVSLLDCRALSSEWYRLYPGLVPREGFEGWASVPFCYSDAERHARGLNKAEEPGDEGGCEEGRRPSPVCKTYWGWRAVRPPPDWRVARRMKEYGRVSGGRSTDDVWATGMGDGTGRRSGGRSMALVEMRERGSGSCAIM